MTDPAGPITVGARVVDFLRNEGIDTLVSICDVSYNTVHRRAVECGMRVIAPRHEAAGVHMADALARMTGRPAVAMAGMGPGVANLVPGVVCASVENVPVVVLVTQRTRSTASAVRRGRFQFTPQIRLFEPVVKFAAIVEGPRRIDEVLAEAFRHATTGRPGPVYVEIPQDVVKEEATFPPLCAPNRYRLAPQGATQAAIEAAAVSLQAARLPLLIGGTGVHLGRAHAAFRRLAELLGGPVVLTYGGRGVLPETHPQVLLPLGPGAEACRQADCVLAVGTSVGESMGFGKPPQFADEDRQRWLLVERDPTAIGVNRPVDVPLVGDLRVVLDQLADALASGGALPTPPQLAEWRTVQEAFRSAYTAGAPDTVPVHPGRAIVEARAAIPEDAVIVRDGGSTGLWEGFCNEQRSTDFLWTSKLGHLGTGLPYALGAQLAVGPQRRVCLITGDSAFGFYPMELETAVRHQLPVVVIVNYDQHWGMEHAGQLADIGRLVECRTAPVRLDGLARALGAHGEFVERTADVRPAVERAFAAGRPAVVQVVTDARANAYEAPGLDEFGGWYAGNY